MRPDLEAVKRQIPLLHYLQSHGWSGRPLGSRNEVVGCCPLHGDEHPSFYVNTARNVFFCHGCGQGGDLLRFVELMLDLPFHDALAHLKRQLDPTLLSEGELLSRTVAFYASLLRTRDEALAYLEQRGIHDRRLLQRLAVGYAPGACLRAYLTDSGFPLDLVQSAGLADNRGRDTLYRRIVIPCMDQGRVVNLYGRSIHDTARHRFLPRPKGGLFAWHCVREFSSTILVEGLFDLLTLWQAGFACTTCGYGTYLTQLQLAQLCDAPREVFVVFDSDLNGAGQHAALSLQHRLHSAGIRTHLVTLPDGHDPNSYFVAGATAADFQACLNEAQNHAENYSTDL
jgi:DNA primase